MKGHSGVSEIDDENSEVTDRFYLSQCLKDDAMAEAITDYVATNSHKNPVVVHLCGKFHSDFGLGTAARVTSRMPLLHTSIISMESTKSVEAFDSSKHADQAHFLLVVPKNQAKESE